MDRNPIGHLPYCGGAAPAATLSAERGSGHGSVRPRGRPARGRAHFGDETFRVQPPVATPLAVGPEERAVRSQAARTRLFLPLHDPAAAVRATDGAVARLATQRADDSRRRGRIPVTCRASTGGRAWPDPRARASHQFDRVGRSTTPMWSDKVAVSTRRFWRGRFAASPALSCSGAGGRRRARLVDSPMDRVGAGIEPGPATA